MDIEACLARTWELMLSWMRDMGIADWEGWLCVDTGSIACTEHMVRLILGVKTRECGDKETRWIRRFWMDCDRLLLIKSISVRCYDRLRVKTDRRSLGWFAWRVRDSNALGRWRRRGIDLTLENGNFHARGISRYEKWRSRETAGRPMVVMNECRRWRWIRLINDVLGYLLAEVGNRTEIFWWPMFSQLRAYILVRHRAILWNS